MREQRARKEYYRTRGMLGHVVETSHKGRAADGRPRMRPTLGASLIGTRAAKYLTRGTVRSGIPLHERNRRRQPRAPMSARLKRLPGDVVTVEARIVFSDGRARPFAAEQGADHICGDARIDGIVCQGLHWQVDCGVQGRRWHRGSYPSPCSV